MENVKKRIVTKGSKTVRPNSKKEKIDTIPIPEKKTKKPSKSAVKQKKKTIPKKVATYRQKLAVKILDEKIANGSKVVLSEILREAGYSEAMAKHPNKVFKSKLVQEKLKLVGFTGEGRDEKHKYLINSRTRQTISYPIEVDTKEIIKKYKEEFPGSRCYNILREGALNIFEFSVPNDSNVKSALEFSFKHYPVIPEKPQVNAAGVSKRKEILRALAEKKGFHLKNPIKLGVSETSSQSTN